MNNYYSSETNTIDCHLITPQDFSAWKSGQSSVSQRWMEALGFGGKSGELCLLPTVNGELQSVVFSLKQADDVWAVGDLPLKLPQGVYRLKGKFSASFYNRAAIVWALGSYRYTRYKSSDKVTAKLFLEDAWDIQNIHTVSASICDVRDWINTPTEDMGPEIIADEMKKICHKNGALFTEIVGDDLLKHNLPAVHRVGRASSKHPRLIDCRWGEKDKPLVTLVGKGVTFDSGGLNIKTAATMQLMRKDMAGAAHVMGLGQCIMAMNLPIQCRLIIPAVENAISGNAYRPGDVIKTRRGLTVEVGNTDCEGRLILCDALALAGEEKPDLIIDFSTLTGAARVALGTEIPALFTRSDDLAEVIFKQSVQSYDPVWRLPLAEQYRSSIDSFYADIRNDTTMPYAGAITAALFLAQFVDESQPWVHFDMMAWNLQSKPGHPEGGEAMAFRLVLDYLKNCYCD